VDRGAGLEQVLDDRSALGASGLRNEKSSHFEMSLWKLNCSVC
jgi:hypothetical protein